MLRRLGAAAVRGFPTVVMVPRLAETIWAEGSPWQADAVTPGVAEEAGAWAVRTCAEGYLFVLNPNRR